MAEWPDVIHTSVSVVEAAMAKSTWWSIYVTRDEVTLAQVITGGKVFQTQVGDENSLRCAVTVPPAEHVWVDRYEVCGYSA